MTKRVELAIESFRRLHGIEKEAATARADHIKQIRALSTEEHSEYRRQLVQFLEKELQESP